MKEGDKEIEIREQVKKTAIIWKALMPILDKEYKAQGPQPQPTKDWIVAEVTDSFQLFLTAQYPALFRLGSVADACNETNK